MTDNIKKLMKIYNITYADMGERLNRSPHTVKQRLNTKSTFHKYEEEYSKALQECISHREQKINKLLKEIE